MWRNTTQANPGGLAKLGAFAQNRTMAFMNRVQHLARQAPRGSMEVLVVMALLAWFALSIADFPPLPQIAVGQDLGIFLDAGWRFAQGQLPHRDYVSPLGPSFALIAGLPLILGGPSFESYKHLPVALCAAFSLLTIVVTHARVPAAVAVTYSITTGLVAGGTYHFGLSPEGLTFATLFNRIGWAGVMVVAAAFGLPQRPQHDRSRSVADAVVAGAVLAFLMFLKMNYFLVGVGMLVLAMALFRGLRERPKTLAIAIAFLAVALWYCNLLGWSIVGMARDLGYAVQARKETWVSSGFWKPSIFVLTNMGLLVGFGVTAVFGIGMRAWRELLFAAVVLASGFALCISNSSGNGFGIPLIVSAVLTLAGGALGRGGPVPQPWSVRLLTWGGFLVAATHAVILPQALSFGIWKEVAAIEAREELQAFRGAPRPLHRLIVGPVSCAWGNDCVKVVREAVELVRTFVPPDKTMMYVDFTNWISFAASARSPRGALLWIDPMATFSRARHPAAETLFHECDFVLVPKYSIGGSDGMSKIKAWLIVYGTYLNSHYEPVDDGSLFVMYRKNTGD